MGFLENYALITLTRNRPTFLKRLLTFISQSPDFGEIVVADTSDDLTKLRNLEIAHSFAGQLRVRVLSLPPSMSIMDAMEAAAKQTTAELLSYCPDDDFVHPDCVATAVDFLTRNPDYALCGGRYSLCSFDGKRVLFTLQSNDSCELPFPLQRVCYLVRNYWPTQFAVQRRQAFIDGIHAFKTGALESALGEILQGSIVALHGKLKVLDIVGISHDVSPHPRQSSSYGNYDTLFTQHGLEKVGQRFITTVVDRLRWQPGFNEQHATAKVQQALVDHLGGHSFIFGDSARRVIEHPQQAQLSGRHRRAIREMALHCFAEISSAAMQPTPRGAAVGNAPSSAVDMFLRRIAGAIRGNVHRTANGIGLIVSAFRRARRSRHLLGWIYLIRRSREIATQIRRTGVRGTVQGILDKGRSTDAFAGFRAFLYLCTKDGEVLLPPLPAISTNDADSVQPLTFSARRTAAYWYKTLLTRSFKSEYENRKRAALSSLLSRLDAEARISADRLYDAHFTLRLSEELSRLYQPRFELAALTIKRLGIRRLSSDQRLHHQRIAELIIGSVEENGSPEASASLKLRNDGDLLRQISSK